MQSASNTQMARSTRSPVYERWHRSDCGRTLDFLSGQQDEGVRFREEAEMLRSFNTGYGLMTEQGDKVVGTSFMYAYPELEMNPRGARPARIFYEIGTQRSIAPGYGLQVFNTCLHLCQTQILENWIAEGADVTIFAVVAPGTPSARNHLEQNGLKPFSPPDILQQLRRERGAAFDPAKQNLFADPETGKRAMGMLDSLSLGKGHYRTPKGDGTIFWSDYYKFFDD